MDDELKIWTTVGLGILNQADLAKVTLRGFDYRARR